MGFFSKTKPAAGEQQPQRLPPALASPARNPNCHTVVGAGLRRRLLFVGGDPTAPKEFDRLLQHRGQSWALALLEHNAFDGVIAAARLPGGSGVELLNELARRFPNLVRLIRYAPEDKPLLRGFVGWPPSHLTRDMDEAEVD